MAKTDTGPQAAAEGVVEEVKGRVKEAVGSITGNDDLKREGTAQQQKADDERDVAKKEAEAEVPETADVELVSLEDADAEATGKKVEGDAVEGDDDLEVEETEEAPFIEEQEEGDDDVTDIIGEGREDEEET